MSKKRRSKDEGFKKIFTNKTNIHWFITEFLGNFLPCKIGLDDIEMLATESINSQWFVFKSDFLRLGVNEMFLNTAEKIREGLKKELAKEREVAIKEGIQQGIQQGKEQALIEVAQRMIAEGAEDSFIAKVTGLSIEKVQELRNNLK